MYQKQKGGRDDDRPLMYIEKKVFLNRQPGIAEGLGRAKMGASRIAFAEVTFDNFIMDIINQGATEGAGRHTGPAFDTTPQVQFNRTCFFVSLEGVKETRFDTGGVITLQAGHRDIFIFGM
jgi:hypothetical protein